MKNARENVEFIVNDTIESLNWFQKMLHKMGGLACVYILTLVISATGYSYFEGKEWMDSLWWAMVTGTTVGYGDMFPVTLGGRLVGVFQMHIVPLFIIPCVVAKILNALIVNENEFTHVEQEELKKELHEVRDLLIELASTRSKT